MESPSFENLKTNFDSQGSILPKEFKIPDLGSFKEYEPGTNISERFDFNHAGQKYQGKISFATSYGDYLCKIVLDISLSADAQVARFSSNIQTASEAAPHGNPKGKPYLFIYNRKVEDKFRKQGLGARCIVSMEDVVKKIGDKYPKLRVNQAVINSGLASLVLVISKLGYVPDKDEEGKVGKILENELTSIDNITDDSQYEQVRFVKNL